MTQFPALYDVVCPSPQDSNYPVWHYESPHDTQWTYLVKRKNEESSTTAGVNNYGNKLGVDWTEGTVPCDSWHADIIVALVILCRLAEDMTEFALPYISSHICAEKKSQICQLSNLFKEILNW